MKRLLNTLAVLCAMILLQGCALYGVYDDQRMTDTISSDKAVSTIIKKDLMAEKFQEGWRIATYCYYGHVFLIGNVPDKMRDRAIAIARRDDRVRSVTTYWYEPKIVEESDTLVSTRVRSNLLTGKNLSSTRIDFENDAGRVVLLGVVADETERDLAIKYARHTKGVKSVTSLLILAPRGGNPPVVPAPITFPGSFPKAMPGEEGIPGEPMSRVPDPAAPVTNASPTDDFDYGSEAASGVQSRDL